MSESSFDVAVIGGGPAGASAAITAARFGARVMLLEAGAFPRHKVCGEFVSAESLDVLRDLLRSTPGVEQVIAAAPVIDRTRLLLGERVIEAHLSPPALSIPRFALDSLLWQAAQQAGVEARSNCEVSAIRGDGPFHLDTSGGKVSARTVIVAAGRWSKFKTLTRLPNGPKWIGVKAHYRETTPPRSTDLYFFEHGYCGVQPVADDVVNVCAMVRPDRATSLEDVFPLHPALAKRRRSWQGITELVTTAPLLHLPPQPVRDNMMFVGDAAAFIDPFVGDGISIALRSGRTAAMDLRAFLDGRNSVPSALKQYQSNYARQFLPLITAASRIRRALSLPAPARLIAFELLRAPGLMPFVIRKTRQAG